MNATKKSLLTSAPLIIFVTLLATCQTSGAPRKSPKQVVAEFWKLETDGGRLTPEGWNRANSFFVRPSLPPKSKVICVIARAFSVGNPDVKGNSAEVIVEIYGDIWEINPEMRSRQTSSYFKAGLVNKLVLTDKHWEFASAGKTMKEVTGPSEWRFEDNGNVIWLTADTAIRYVRQVSDKSADPVVKRNANRTIATLRHHLL